MANKKTVVQMYEEILAVEGLTAEQKAFIEKRIEITKKKNEKRSTEPTPKELEKMAHTAEVKTAIVDAMAEGVQYTATDIVKLIDRDDVTSTQKVTPLLTALVDDNQLVKAIVKGRSVYSLPVAE